ncbi:MAG: tripartite tricarboxylate transporter substrate binding protein, partial [Comamonadaceae bacterium]|nr:tripartite tricarboxylate transporter substrate binding protein [Comamonadaceae bacterium]
MTPGRRALLAAAVGLAPLGHVLAQAGAEPYPSRPLRIVVPYPPGAVNDAAARLLAHHLAPALGQPVVVENRPGAGGHLGAEQVARSAPDGHTLVIGTSGLITIGPHLYRRLAYDPQKDLVPVYRFATVPYAFGVPPSLGLKTVHDLVALAKARPGALNFASSGNGSVPHLCGELFNMVAGVKMVHVPYKGGGPAMTAVLGGEVDLHYPAAAVGLPHVKAGRVRALG